MSAGITVANQSGQLGSMVERVAEELWQKGYDLKKAGFGWIVREPLGTRKVELESDEALIRFATGQVGSGGGERLKSSGHPPVVPRTDDSPADDGGKPVSQPPVNPSLAPLSIVERRKITRKDIVKYVTYALVVTIGLAVLLGIGSVFNKTANSSTTTSEHASLNASTEAPPVSLVKMVAEGAAASRQNEHSVMPIYVDRPDDSLDSVEQSSDNKELSAFSDQCAQRIEERFGIRKVSLLFNEQGRNVGTCFSVHGKTHCSYVLRGRVALNFADPESTLPTIYACDVSITNGTFGNLRIVETNPDILRFLMTEGAVTR